MTNARLELDPIRAARDVIDPVFLGSPQYECVPLGEALGCSMTLKVETLNSVGSFKGRGSETVMAWLADREETPDAVCASAGNLGQALAYSGARRNMVLVALGGGAMASGVGFVAKALAPDVEVIGVQPHGAPAMRLLYLHAGLVVEPSAALGVAAVLEDPERFAGRRIASIICGGNVATTDFERWALVPG